MTMLLLVVLAPLVGWAVALLLPRPPRETSDAAHRRIQPIVVQRNDSSAQALLADESPVPRRSHETNTRGVFLVPDVQPLTNPALVTLGRIGEEDVLVDVTQTGVLSLRGTAETTMETLRAVWSELRWPAESHELEVLGVGLTDFPKLRNVAWSHALTALERGDERTRPLVVVAAHPPCGDEAVRLHAAARPGGNVGVVVAGEWDGPWRMAHHDDHAVLRPLDLRITPLCSAKPESAGPGVAHAVPDESDEVSVSVLGPVTVRGRTLSAKETELVAFLALAPTGLTEGQIRTALWPDRDAPRGTFNNLVSSTRRHLGTNGNGELLLPRVTTGRYRIHPSVNCDLNVLDEAVAGNDLDRVARCLLGVTGRAFDGWTGADWPFDDAVVARAEVLVDRAVRMLAAGDGSDLAVSAIVNASRASPDPDLLREAI